MSRIRRENELIVPFLQVIADVVSIECAFLFSYWFRFYSPLTKIFPVVKGFPPLQVYFGSSWVAVVVWLFIFQTLGFYGTRRDVGKIDEFYRVVKGATLGMLIVTVAAFFYRGFSYSRLVFILIWVTSIFLLSITRALVSVYEKHLHRIGKGMLNAAIVGSSKWGADIFDRVNLHPGLGLHIVGYIGKNKVLSKRTACLGSFKEVAAIARRENIHIFFLALEDKESVQLVFLITECIDLNIEFYLIPNLLEMMTSRLRVEEFGGIPVLKIKDVAITGWKGIFKRLFDVTVAFIALLFLWPLFIVIALAIRLDSKGGMFYKQRRVGMDGHEFKLIKFRSMFVDAEDRTGPVWAVKDDRRVTRAGRVLRKASLDELPQLINVLKGEMSLVGPRPERHHFVEQFKTRVPKYLERHRVKSGMTGWAQVNGLRGNVSIEERTKYDIYYVENWSLLFDLKIILMTIWAVIVGKNSY